jgi:hypothetical protein
MTFVPSGGNERIPRIDNFSIFDILAEADEKFLLLARDIFIIVIVVVVQFKATGNAPILKQNKFKVSADQRFETVMAFLRKQLPPTESLAS